MTKALNPMPSEKNLDDAEEITSIYMEKVASMSTRAQIVGVVATHLATIEIYESMLAALKLCADGLESNGEGRGGDVLISEKAYRAVHAAIAKAEGRN